MTKGHFWEDAQHPKASCHGNTGHEPIKGFTSSAVHDGRGDREITPAEEQHSSVNEVRCDSRGSRFVVFSLHPKRSQRSDLEGRKEGNVPKRHANCSCQHKNEAYLGQVLKRLSVRPHRAPDSTHFGFKGQRQLRAVA